MRDSFTPDCDALSGITAVIPAYQSEKTIADLIQACQLHVDLVIVIDDGSLDSTTELARQAGAKTIRLERNSGKSQAILEGFISAANTGAAVVVTIDSDLEHDPSDIPSLIRPIADRECDVAFGSRERSSAHRLVGTSLSQRFFSGLRRSVRDPMCGFRAYSSAAVEYLMPKIATAGFGVDFEIAVHICESNFRIREIAINDALMLERLGFRESHIAGLCENLERFPRLQSSISPSQLISIRDALTSRQPIETTVYGTEIKLIYNEKSGLYEP